jgi:hypothetical protein
VTPPLEFTREHEAIVRLVVQLTRGIAGKYFPRKLA